MINSLHIFDTEQEFEEVYYGDGYYEPWVSFVKEDGQVMYNDNPSPGGNEPIKSTTKSTKSI